MPLPQKASFQRLKPDGSPDGAAFPVQVNPTEYTLSKGVQIAEMAIPGLDMPVLQFVRGQTESLSLDLFFDSTDEGMGVGATQVTKKTDKFYQLIKIDRDTHAPPIVLFTWGKSGFAGAGFTDQFASQARTNGFTCIVESVKQRFTLFSPEGLPLRATLTVTLKEYRTIEDQIQKIDFHSRTQVYVVQTGDTLARIAARRYSDPTQWRAIADANNLTDPLALSPGMALSLPPVEG
jgi:nucleoid-associated protein YgaU